MVVCGWEDFKMCKLMTCQVLIGGCKGLGIHPVLIECILLLLKTFLSFHLEKNPGVKEHIFLVS